MGEDEETQKKALVEFKYHRINVMRSWEITLKQ